MSVMAFQTTGNIKEKLRPTIPLWGESTSDQWIPRTKGQWCRKRLHVTIPSWSIGNDIQNPIYYPKHLLHTKPKIQDDEYIVYF